MIMTIIATQNGNGWNGQPPALRSQPLSLAHGLHQGPQDDTLSARVPLRLVRVDEPHSHGPADVGDVALHTSGHRSQPQEGLVLRAKTTTQ